MKNKKGVSVIVGYVLLIVIAMSLSILVYAWLKSYVLAPEEPCPEGVSLIISNFSCDNNLEKIIYITFENHGKFTIDGFIARASENLDSLATCKLKRNAEDGGGEGTFFFFNDAGLVRLKPGEKITQKLNYAGCVSPGNQLKILEIIPLRTGEETICEHALVRELIPESKCI